MEHPIAIQSPGGEIHYCKNDNATQDNNNQEDIVITLDIEYNYILNRYEFLVRFICIYDIIKNYILFINSLNPNVYYIYNTIISSLCLISTYNYNRLGIILYIIYNNFNLSIYIIEIILLNDIVVIDTNIIINNNTTNNNYYIDKTINIISIREIVLSVNFLFEIVIIVILLKYYKMKNINNNILY